MKGSGATGQGGWRQGRAGETPAGQSRELVRSPMNAAVFRTLTAFGQSLGSLLPSSSCRPLSFDADMIRSHQSLPLLSPLTPGRPKARRPGCSSDLTSFPRSLTSGRCQSLLGVPESMPRARLAVGFPGRGLRLTGSLFV